MTFLYGTNCELLYSMPAAGASITINTKQIVSATTTTNPAFWLPPLQNLWSPSQMIGKAFHFCASGGQDTAAGTNTMALTLDSAFSTSTFTIASTGAATWAAQTTGMWQFVVDMTCVSAGLTASSWQVGGNITAGPGNNPTGFGSTMTFANTITAGVPQALVIPTNVSYMPTIYSTWSTSPTAFNCSQFLIYGQN